MEYNKLIAGMHTGDDVEGFYVLKDAFLKTTAAGKPFLSGVLADRSGTIDLKVWDYSGPIGANPADTGRIVKIRGQVSEFKGAPQLTAGRIRMADGNDQYDVSALVPVAPIDPDERLQEIRRLIDSMEDADYQSVARTMLERHLEAFRSIPAAKSVHHSFLSGLLMHTSNMLRLADYLSGLYAGIIDRSLLLTGTLLHDFAKEREFTFSGLGMVTDYSLSGQLIGHLVMGAQEVQQCAESLGLPQEKSLLLQHMILSHHGEPDFGAAVRPMCAEAELLSLIDLVDSRMEIYAEALQELPEGTFSGRIFALDKRSIAITEQTAAGALPRRFILSQARAYTPIAYTAWRCPYDRGLTHQSQGAGCVHHRDPHHHPAGGKALRTFQIDRTQGPCRAAAGREPRAVRRGPRNP